MAEFKPPISHEDHFSFVDMANRQMNELGDKCDRYRKAIEEALKETEVDGNAADCWEAVREINDILEKALKEEDDERTTD